MDKDLIKERRKEIFAILNYSIGRIDLLIISISGACILLELETLKYLNTQKIPFHISLKISATCFILAIIINFISQFTGYKAASYEYISIHIELKENITEEQQTQADDLCNKAEFLGKICDPLNYISSFFMILGLIILYAFYTFTF